MANAAALINEGLWRKDKDFQRLPRLAQCTFCQVLSQRDLDTAGVLTLHIDLLAKGCDELTPEQLRADFAVLEASRFLFVDYETDELFIRSYVRNVSVKNRNSWHSVPKNSLMVASPKIRRELAAELRRLRRKDASDIADEIDPRDTPSGPGRDGVETGSEHGTGSTPARDGDSQVLVPELVSRSVVGHLGEGTTHRPHCPDHAENHTGPCRPCEARRKWDEEHEGEIRRSQLEEKRRLREIALNCPRCQGTNTYTVGDGFAAKCDHQTPPEALNA